MGSSASKGARAATSSVRKYPNRIPTTTTTTINRPTAAQPSQSTPSPPQANPPTPQASDPNTRDPLLASRLTSLGVVTPNPHYSPTSTSPFDPRPPAAHGDTHPDMMTAPPPAPAFPSPRDNPALRVLEARARIQSAAERELETVGRRGFSGRCYVDVGVLQLALMRRKRGEAEERIEEGLGIRRGRLSVLGRGVVEAV